MRTLTEMARAAQHDDRQATGKLYGDLADRIEALEAALRKIVNSANLNIQPPDVWFRDIARAALAPEQDK